MLQCTGEARQLSCSAVSPRASAMARSSDASTSPIRRADHTGWGVSAEGAIFPSYAFADDASLPRSYRSRLLPTAELGGGGLEPSAGIRQGRSKKPADEAGFHS